MGHGTNRATGGTSRMKAKLKVTTRLTLNASAVEVWDALTKPELAKKYMMGADVKSDWKLGGPLVYTGEYRRKRFEEKGVIQKVDRAKVLQATHFSTTSGKADTPENYGVVTWELDANDDTTTVTVSQDGPKATADRGKGVPARSECS